MHMKKNEKGPENYTTAKFCPAHHINVTARRLCPLNETVTVSFTQHSQLHPTPPSLLLLLPSSAKAPDLHTVSVFDHSRPFLALLIVHLATLSPSD